MHTKQSDSRLDTTPIRGFEQLGEFRSNVVPDVREPSQRDCFSANLSCEHPRAVEDVDQWMDRQQRVGDLRALVITWHEVHGDACISHAFEWLKRFMHEAGRHAAPVEEVAAVYDEIDLLIKRRVENALEVGKEIVTAPAALDAWALRQIETEMRVG
jgi:hypothetical protein